MSYKNILIIGAGGNLGPAVLTVLLASNAFNITVLTRKSSKSTFPSSVKTVQISDDYPSSELEAAFKGQDAILCFVGGEGLGNQPKFIDAAVKAGVKRFFPSEYGVSLKSPKAMQILPMFQGKIDVVNYLRSKERDGLTWSSVVSGPFFDWGLKVGFLGFNIQSKSATIYAPGTQRFSASNQAFIGRALAALLLNPSAFVNQYVYIASFTTSQNEILAALEKASGTYKTETSTVDALIAQGRGKFEKGDYMGGFPDLILANLYGGEGNDHEAGEGLANEKLGLTKESLEESIKYVLERGAVP